MMVSFNTTVLLMAKMVTLETSTRWKPSRGKQHWTACRYQRRCWTCCTFHPSSWSCAWISKSGQPNGPNSPGWWATSLTSTYRSLTPWPRHWAHSICTCPCTRTSKMELAIDGWILAFYPSAAIAFYSIKSRFNILQPILTISNRLYIILDYSRSYRNNLKPFKTHFKATPYFLWPFKTTLTHLKLPYEHVKL